MKKINIFLASSLIEFSNERMVIENFIRNVSDKFEEHYNVKIQPLLCENFDDAYSKTRKQEEYNEKIRESELCFFIFFTKAGEYTQEEFQVAREKFEKTGKPKIYTYFKIIKDETAEQSLYDFMNELDKTFGHYYGTFEHIDTVKLRILLSLKLQEMDFLEIKSENGKCLVDGRAVMQLDNVSEFTNNKNLEKLRQELTEVEKEYNKLKPDYAKGNCDNEFYSRYSDVASKRQNLIDEIEELQKLIFNISLQMSYDNVHGEISLRQKEAYRLFELGDYDGCMAVLDSKDIDNDFLRKRRKIKEQDIAVCRKYIKEHKTAIDILETMINYENRFSEIDERYGKIIPVIFSEGIEYNVAIDYASYLSQQNRSKEAADILEKLKDAASCEDVQTDISLHKVYLLLGDCYSDQNQPDKAEMYYIKAIDIYETLASNNPERFNQELAACYNDAGIFYKDQGNPEKAEMYYHEAIEIGEKLVEENPERFNPELADSYYNAGSFYSNRWAFKKAEEYYIKAAEIYETFAKTNSKRFNPNLANYYNGIGAFYEKQGNIQQAKKYHLCAMIIKEKLAEENPKRFNPELANSYNNVAISYQNQGDLKNAEMYYIKAIEIYKNLVDENFEKFTPNLATIYNNLGDFYEQVENFEQAEEYYLKAMRIRENLAKANPRKYNHDLANTYSNLSCFYTEQGKREQAEKYFFKTIGIYEELVKMDPERFKPDLARCYNNAGSFYIRQGNLKIAEEYYLKALGIREKLVMENPKKFDTVLVDSYNNVGYFYSNQGNLKKAGEYFFKAIKICEHLTSENSENSDPVFAVSFFNYAIFSKNTDYFDKALKLAKTNPDNPYCKQIIESLEN